LWRIEGVIYLKTTTFSGLLPPYLLDLLS